MLILQTGGLGATDCEAIGTGVLAQPVNAISSLAYVAVGLWVLAGSRRRRARSTLERPFALAMIGVGVGSFLFHGPMPPAARWLHDMSIVALLVVLVAGIVASLAHRPARGVVPTVVLVVAAIITALLPEAGILIAFGLVVVLIGSEAWRRLGRDSPPPPGWLMRSGLLVIAATALQLLGRSGGPLCDPSSWYQGHAAWHVLTALALGLYGPAALAEVQPRVPGSSR